MTKGLFVSFEGIDGSGKSTQARRLAAKLQEIGYGVTLTREPGGSAGAEEIRALVLQGEPDRWSAETELLLFTAARRDHLERTIRPALEAGQVVICDRFADSTRLYQGRSRGDLGAAVEALHSLMIGVEPDLTVLIDMDPEAALSRAKARATAEERFEDFGLSLQQSMRKGFLELAQTHAGRIVVIDGNHPPDTVAEAVLALITAHLPALRAEPDTKQNAQRAKAAGSGTGTGAGTVIDYSQTTTQQDPAKA